MGLRSSHWLSGRARTVNRSVRNGHSVTERRSAASTGASSSLPGGPARRSRTGCGRRALVSRTGARAAARFTLERPIAPLEIAIAGIAERLVEGAPDVGPVDRVTLLESATGAQSDLGAYLAQRLEGELTRRMVERARHEGNEARMKRRRPCREVD